MAVGAGAFSSVSVDRSVTVNVEGDDADAYLQLTPEDEDIAEIENGKLELNFGELTDDDDTGTGGEGVNQQSETEFTEVFSVTNQGRQEVRLIVDENDAEEENEWELRFYADGTSLNGAPDNDNNDGITLGSGDDEMVDVVIDNIDEDDEIDTEVSIYAVADDSELYEDGPTEDQG